MESEVELWVCELNVKFQRVPEGKPDVVNNTEYVYA